MRPLPGRGSLPLAQIALSLFQDTQNGKLGGAQAETKGGSSAGIHQRPHAHNLDGIADLIVDVAQLLLGSHLGPTKDAA